MIEGTLQPDVICRSVKRRRIDETCLQVLHQHRLHEGRKREWRCLHRRMPCGICQQNGCFGRTIYPDRVSGTKVLDRPESSPRCLFRIDALLEMAENGKANALALSNRCEEHVRAYQANLDEVCTLILLFADFFYDDLGRPSI